MRYNQLIVSPLLGLIKDYGDDLQMLKYIIIISSFPIILISLYLLYFSLTLIEKRKQAIFIILKTIQPAGKRDIGLFEDISL